MEMVKAYMRITSRGTGNNWVMAFICVWALRIGGDQSPELLMAHHQWVLDWAVKLLINLPQSMGCSCAEPAVAICYTEFCVDPTVMLGFPEYRTGQSYGDVGI